MGCSMKKQLHLACTARGAQKCDKCHFDFSARQPFFPGSAGDFDSSQICFLVTPPNGPYHDSKHGKQGILLGPTSS